MSPERRAAPIRTTRRARDLSDPTVVADGGWHRRLQLRDGTRVLLRQIRPEDRDRLAQGLRELSPASRYLRFHSAIEELSDAQLRYLTEVDHVDHEAIVAVDLDRPDRRGVGVARYIREPYERHVAEAAITVADDYHGRGAGTVLLGSLAARARANGVMVFRNYVLDGNHAMLEVFDHLGATRTIEGSGLWRVDLPLPESEEDLPDSPAGQAFLGAARGERHLVSHFPPVWGRVRETVANELDDLRTQLEHWITARGRPGPAFERSDGTAGDPDEDADPDGR